MALTVASIVNDVVVRLRGRLAFAGLSAARDATNADIVPAVRDALAYLGVVPSDPSTVTDSDLANVLNVKMFRDAATLETLYVIRGALTDAIDETVGEHSQKLHQFADDLEKMIANYESKVPTPNYPTGTMGQMAMPPIPNDPFIPCASNTSPYSYPYPSPSAIFPTGGGC